MRRFCDKCSCAAFASVLDAASASSPDIALPAFSPALPKTVPGFGIATHPLPPPSSLSVACPCTYKPAALAYTLAALTPGVMVAMPAMCFILIISLILCGFMIRAPAVPVYW